MKSKGPDPRSHPFLLLIHPLWILIHPLFDTLPFPQRGIKNLMEIQNKRRFFAPRLKKRTRELDKSKREIYIFTYCAASKLEREKKQKNTPSKNPK